MTRRGQGFARRTAPDERGVVLVWTAILMVVILGFTAWSVDFWHGKRDGVRAQKAADAAALAGAVFMPENLGGIAFSTAREVATKNGYTDGVNGVTVNVVPGQQPNQLKVTITERVDNVFGSAIGVATGNLARTGVGEYQRPVSMGSPINQFGNDPTIGAVSHGSTRYPDFWTNVFGPSSNKGKGDAIQSTICDGADNCSGSNSDYDPNGYFYGIDVQASGTPLTVQAFDPEFAHVGDNCGDNDNGSNLKGASILPANFNPRFAVPDSATRYSPAADSPYCTGDMYYTEGNNVVPWTVYKLRAPDLSPADPTDNPVICSIEFPGFKGDLATALDPDRAAGRRARPLREVLPPVVHAVHRQQPDRRHVLPADRDEYEDQRQRGAVRRRREPAGAAGRSERQHADGLGPDLRQRAHRHLRQLPRGQHDLLPRPGAPRRAGPDARTQLLRRRRRGPAGGDHRAATGRVESRRGLRRLHVHGAAREPDRAALGCVRRYGLRMPYHERQQRELQRAVDPGPDPDPEHLHV